MHYLTNIAYGIVRITKLNTFSSLSKLHNANNIAKEIVRSTIWEVNLQKLVRAWWLLRLLPYYVTLLIFMTAIRASIKTNYTT